MPTFETQRRVSFTPRQMYDVVADVERYPEFLPLCEGLEVQSRTPKGAGSILVATMTVGYKAIRESFTSRVTLAPADPSVLVEFLDGPFDHLTNRWRFTEVPGATLVDFFIEYEFRTTMYRLLMGAIFDSAIHRYAEAFEARAQTLYGNAAPPRKDGMATR